MARSAFARYKARVRQWRAKPKASLKPKMNFLEARRNTANYSILEEKNWRYEDKEDWVKNPLNPANSPHPHLVLCDGGGTPRFTLRYRPVFIRDLSVSSLQRERTTYKGRLRHFWSAKEETRASKEFQEQLGGIHPAEFLLSEFIYRHRAEMRKGARMFLDIYVTTNELKIYMPIIERFFKKLSTKIDSAKIFVPDPGPLTTVLAILSPEKRRVKEILAVP